MVHCNNRNLQQLVNRNVGRDIALLMVQICRKEFILLLLNRNALEEVYLEIVSTCI